MDHLNPVAVRLGLGVLPWRERDVVLHLLICEECRTGLLCELEQGDFLRPAAGGAEPQGDLLAGTPYGRSLDDALDRAELAVLERVPAVARERAVAQNLLSELWLLPPAEWPTFFARPLPAAFLGLVIDVAAGSVDTDPRTSLLVQRLVRPAIERADLPPTLRQELTARAFIVAGRVVVRGQAWLEADTAFGEAGRALAAVAASPEVAAELCRGVAEMYERQGRPVEAAALLAHAALLAGQAEDLLGEIGDLGRQARLLEERGHLDQAIGLWAAALLRTEEAGLLFSAAHLRLRLVWVLRRLGFYRESLSIAPPAFIEAAGAETRLGRLAVAFGSACRGEVQTAKAQFSAELANAVFCRESMAAATAALSLLQISVQEGTAPPPILTGVCDLLSSDTDFQAPTRTAFAALHEALRDDTGTLGSLLLAAATALDHYEAKRFLN